MNPIIKVRIWIASTMSDDDGGATKTRVSEWRDAMDEYVKNKPKLVGMKKFEIDTNSIVKGGVRYKGGFKDGLKHGEGILEENKQWGGKFNIFLRTSTLLRKIGYYRYEGEFKNGEKHGRGVEISADGTLYEGEFKYDRRHGKGILTTKSGSRYEGEFKDGLKHGIGVQISADGTRFKGEFRRGLKVEPAPKKNTNRSTRNSPCAHEKGKDYFCKTCNNYVCKLCSRTGNCHGEGKMPSSSSNPGGYDDDPENRMP